uniref:PIH1 domain-containing protein 2 n=1 Tax=Salvator merianae TaxID=96440 RepID=A0A8D0E7Y9_SALMN
MMEMRCSSEDMLSKATQLWAVLDDMAENDPEGYHQFMQQQLKDAKQYFAPLEPYLCVKTSILDPTEKPLFINLCRWNKVPAPHTTSDPIPVRAGKMEEVLNQSEFYHVLDIAYNPSVLERGKDDPVSKKHLIDLSLIYIKKKYSIMLSHSYTITDFKIKGSLEEMRQRLTKQKLVALSQKNARKELTLDHLRNIITKEDSSDPSLPMENTAPTKTGLIEVISSTEKPEESCTPAYKVTTKKGENGKPTEIEVTVELPRIHSVSECKLSVSKADLLLQCSEKYRLHLNLPELVNEEATAAKFYKKKGLLLITLPVCLQK